MAVMQRAVLSDTSLPVLPSMQPEPCTFTPQSLTWSARRKEFQQRSGMRALRQMLAQSRAQG